MATVEPTYTGYLTHNGERIGLSTKQSFEFVPDPDNGELHAVNWREMVAGRTFTVTCDWHMSSAYDFWEELYPEPRWQAFEQAIDRMLRWIWW